MGSTSDEAALEGGAFYDQEAVFQIYRNHRLSPTNPNDLLEEPTLLELIGAVHDLRILDLGCGDAALGRRLLDRGCQSYTGVDASHNMVRAAWRSLQGTRGVALHGNIEAFVAEPGSSILFFRGWRSIMSRIWRAS